MSLKKYKQNFELEKENNNQTDIQLSLILQAIQLRKISNNLLKISLVLGVIWLISLFSIFSYTNSNKPKPIEKSLMISVSIMLSVSTSLTLTTGLAEILVKKNIKK